MSMNAVVQRKVGGNDTLEDATVDRPSAEGRDVLVKIAAVATNPVDYKKREGFGSPELDMNPRILGWDASGVVEAVGGDVVNFKVGDEVYFAGSLPRQGCFAEYCVVDERLVGVKPKSLSHSEAACFPLVALTAWEQLSDNFNLVAGADNSGKTLLVINGAGGVGSILTQLAKKIFNVGTVIATASRDTTIEWCKKMGADKVINHRQPLKDQLDGAVVDFAAVNVDIDGYVAQLADIVRCKGRIGFITFADPKIDFSAFFFKAISVHAELMFARPMWGYDEETQKSILDQVSKAIDDKQLVSLKTKEFEGFNTKNIVEALELQATGKSHGKIAVSF